jgi:UDP-N-acetyl-D-glucosamine dehydrogenase
MMLLDRLGAQVSYSDPYVASVQLSGTMLYTQEMLSSVSASDCVVIVTDHTGIDYAEVIEQSKVIVDTRNALKGFRSTKIVRL